MSVTRKLHVTVADRDHPNDPLISYKRSQHTRTQVTLEGFESFWNTSLGFSEHQVGAWTILYTLVKVRLSWKLLIVVSKAPRSLSVNYEACYIDGLHKYFGGP